MISWKKIDYCLNLAKAVTDDVWKHAILAILSKTSDNS